MMTDFQSSFVIIIVMSNDQKYYLEATKEFDEGRLDEALWSKMLSVNQGDETKAKYSYIKHRAKELQKEAVRKSFSNSFRKGPFSPRVQADGWNKIKRS